MAIMQDRSANDRALVAALAENADGFAEIYRAHLLDVTRAARAVVRDADLADDVAQDVFLHLWSRPEGFDPARGSLVGYLRTLARHRAIDVLRAEEARRRRQRLDDAARERTQLSRESADVADHVVRRWHTLERVSAVRRALEQLPGHQREALRRAYFAECTRREIGEELGIPEGTVKTRVRDGLARLRSDPALLAVQS